MIDQFGRDVAGHPDRPPLQQMVRNIRDLQTFYGMTGDRHYLDPIRRVVRWLENSYINGDPTQTEPLRTNSSRRYQNAMKQVLAGKSMDQLMNDRSPSGALCQRGENGMYTDFAAVFAPVELQFKFWSGYPNKVVTETIALKERLGNRLSIFPNARTARACQL